MYCGLWYLDVEYNCTLIYMFNVMLLPAIKSNYQSGIDMYILAALYVHINAYHLFIMSLVPAITSKYCNYQSVNNQPSESCAYT